MSFVESYRVEKIINPQKEQHYAMFRHCLPPPEQRVFSIDRRKYCLKEFKNYFFILFQKKKKKERKKEKEYFCSYLPASK
jgi:hypothetical protein